MYYSGKLSYFFAFLFYFTAAISAFLHARLSCLHCQTLLIWCLSYELNDDDEVTYLLIFGGPVGLGSLLLPPSRKFSVREEMECLRCGYWRVTASVSRHSPASLTGRRHAASKCDCCGGRLEARRRARLRCHHAANATIEMTDDSRCISCLHRQLAAAREMLYLSVRLPSVLHTLVCPRDPRTNIVVMAIVYLTDNTTVQTVHLRKREE